MSENNRMNKFLGTMKSAADKVSKKTAVATEEIKNKATQFKSEIATKQAENKVIAMEKKKADDFKKFAPIFERDISEDELLTERVIRIVNYDARLENEVCKNSVGFYEISADRKMPTFYTKFAQKLGLTFYPQLSESVFIADPCIAGKYIEIDEYYNYMKQARVNELTIVAQALNAKSISIKLKATEKSKSKTSIAANANIASLVNANGNVDNNSKDSKSVEIWASTTFKAAFWNGGPVMPQLLYFRNESDINALIQMVLTSKSKLTERTYSMKASSSSGMTKNEALSIASVIKHLKCNIGANFSKCAENESDAVIEYTIKF